LIELLFLVGEVGDSGGNNVVLFGQLGDGAVLGKRFQSLVNLSGQVTALLEADGVVLNIAGESVNDFQVSVVALAAVALGQLCVNNSKLSGLGVYFKEAIGLCGEGLDGCALKGLAVSLANRTALSGADLALQVSSGLNTGILLGNDYLTVFHVVIGEVDLVSALNAVVIGFVGGEAFQIH